MKKSILSLASLLLGLAAVGAAPLGTAFTYQGRLDFGGAPVTGYYDFNFKLYDAVDGGTLFGPAAGVSINGAGVTNGVFTVFLDFGAVFTGTARWLDMSVNTNLARPLTPLPRQAVLPTPYALYAANAGSATTAVSADTVAAGAVTSAGLGNNAVTGAKIANGNVVRSLNGLSDALTLAAGANITLTPAGNTLTISGTSGGTPWLLTGNGGTDPAVNFLGTTDNKALELKANSARALRLEPSGNSPNLIGGHVANTVVAGSYGGTIGGGGTVGLGHQITGVYGTIAGGVHNTIGAHYASVGGGFGNTASGQDSVVAGGSANTAQGGQSTIGGGIANRVAGPGGTVVGGQLNFVGAAAVNSSILGGTLNTNTAGSATVLNGNGVLADKFGQIAFGSRFATNGDAQASLYHLRGVTTGAFTNELFLDGSGLRLKVPRHGAWTFDALVVGKTISSPNAAAFQVRGLVVNLDGTLQVYSTTTSLGTYGAIGWGAVADFNVADGALVLKVYCPVGGGTARWSAQVSTAEVNAVSSIF